MTYDSGRIADGYDPMQVMGDAADEINRLREALRAVVDIEWPVRGDVEDLRTLVSELKAENDKLREALAQAQRIATENADIASQLICDLGRAKARGGQ